MTSYASDPIPRRRLGVVSLWIAIFTFAIVVGVLAAIVYLPKSAPASLRDAVLWVCIAIFGTAPIAHIVGFLLGLIAMLRANDHRLLGLVGALLNAAAVGLGVTVVLLFWHGLSSMP